MANRLSIYGTSDDAQYALGYHVPKLDLLVIDRRASDREYGERDVYVLRVRSRAYGNDGHPDDVVVNATSHAEPIGRIGKGHLDGLVSLCIEVDLVYREHLVEVAMMAMLIRDLARIIRIVRRWPADMVMHIPVMMAVMVMDRAIGTGDGHPGDGPVVNDYDALRGLVDYEVPPFVWQAVGHQDHSP